MQPCCMKYSSSSQLSKIMMVLMLNSFILRTVYTQSRVRSSRSPNYALHLAMWSKLIFWQNHLFDADLQTTDSVKSVSPLLGFLAYLFL